MLSTVSIIVRLAWDLILWCGLLLRPRESLEAEILFLRRQLALVLSNNSNGVVLDRDTTISASDGL